ncbi:MAG: sugar kinase [Christensenellaceae bacterium]|nr:sugar kinase [Christensenellaceae bacterium]
MKGFLTFGEIMLRLQPPGYLRFGQGSSFDFNFGGGEANVAVALSRLGKNACFFTKLPQNAIADACIRELKGLGVDTTHILRGGERMGIYYSERGVSQRPSSVIYDRKNSAINSISLSEIDKSIFDGIDWFHFSGITAALSKEALSALEFLLELAREKKIKVSCDLNYRKKLWDREKAKKIMSALMPYTNILISNEEECSDVFGLVASGTKIEEGVIDSLAYLEVCKKIKEMFPNIESVAFTLRSSVSASKNNWSGVFFTKEGFFKAKDYSIDIVDRIGSGDSFVAGLIFSLMENKNSEYAINFAVAASCLKHSIVGDFNNVSLIEIEALMNGNQSGRVQR